MCFVTTRHCLQPDVKSICNLLRILRSYWSSLHRVILVLLHLHQVGWWTGWDSNPQQLECKSSALPIGATGPNICTATGNRTPIAGMKIPFPDHLEDSRILYPTRDSNPDPPGSKPVVSANSTSGAFGISICQRPNFVFVNLLTSNT